MKPTKRILITLDPLTLGGLDHRARRRKLGTGKPCVRLKVMRAALQLSLKAMATKAKRQEIAA